MMLKLKKLWSLGIVLTAVLGACFICTQTNFCYAAGESYGSGQAELVVEEESSCDDFIIDEEGNLTDYTGYARKVIIPETVGKISYGVFMEKSEIEAVIFPEDLISIDEYAFYGCKNIKEIILPESTQRIGRLAFGDCRGVEVIYFGKKLTYLGEFVLWGCENLAYISVNESNKNFSEYDGILYNKNKTHIVCCPAGRDGSVVLPDSVVTIDSYAFFDCTKVEKIRAGENLMYVDEAAFYGCKSLVSAKLGEKIKKIRAAAFEECELLEEFTVAKSVKSIGSGVFSDCPALKNVIFLNENTQIGEKIFSRGQKVKISGYEGSTAEDYAVKNGFSFKKL